MENDKPTLINEEKIPPGKPWGVWALIGFTFLLFVIQVITVMIIVGIVVFLNSEWTFKEMLQSEQFEGLSISIELISSMFFALPFIFLFAKLRKGYPLKEYLGLKTVPWKTTLKWIGVLLVLLIIEDFILYVSPNNLVDEFMIRTYETSYSPWILFFAVIIAAPLIEEFYFRAFLFETVRFTRIGDWGAIIFTSIFWALVHVQYDALGIIMIFAGGIVLSLARIKTQSIYVPIILHMLMNFIATCELLIVLQLQENTPAIAGVF